MAEVARGTRRIRAATGPARRRVEAADAGIEAGRDVGQGRPARVVEVEGDPLERDAGLHGQPGQGGDLARHADTDRVAEADLVDPEVEQAQGDVDGLPRIDATGVRAAERGRDIARDATSRARPLGRGRARRRPVTPRSSSRCWPGVKASVAAVKTAMASTPAASARSRPRTFGHEDRVAHAGTHGPGRSAGRRHPRAAGSRAATRSSSPRSRAGRRRPSRPMNAAFVSVGMTADSFCSPSRGPTS